MNKADIVWNCMNTCEYVQNEARASLRFLAGLTWQKFLSSMNAKNSHRMDSMHWVVTYETSRQLDVRKRSRAHFYHFWPMRSYEPKSLRALLWSFGKLQLDN